MPVYNAAKDLREAIDSILNQTYRDFEFLIVDDGSTDSSNEIICSYCDPRIQLIQNKQNVGIVDSLNIGLDVARGDYIARMDADDISLETRFSQQIALLEESNADICGSHWLVINPKGKILSAKIVPTEKDAFTSHLANGVVPFAHGSIMLRKNFLTGHSLKYGPNKYAEDYYLWTQIFKDGGRFINCNSFLYQYREYGTSLSKVKGQEYSKRANEIREEFLLENQNVCAIACQNQITIISQLSHLEKVNLFCLALNLWPKMIATPKILKLLLKLNWRIIGHGVFRLLKRKIV